MKHFLLNTTGKSLFAAGLFCLLIGPAWPAGTDYAMPMKKAASSLLLDIAAVGDRLVAVGERGHILYSVDGGESWVQTRVPTSAMLTRVFFISDKLGWAVGHDGNILVSRDGGVNWELQREGISAQAQLNEVRAGKAFRAPHNAAWDVIAKGMKQQFCHESECTTSTPSVPRVAVTEDAVCGSSG